MRNTFYLILICFLFVSCAAKKNALIEEAVHLKVPKSATQIIKNDYQSKIEDYKRTPQFHTMDVIYSVKNMFIGFEEDTIIERRFTFNEFQMRRNAMRKKYNDVIIDSRMEIINGQRFLIEDYYDFRKDLNYGYLEFYSDFDANPRYVNGFIRYEKNVQRKEAEALLKDVLKSIKIDR